MSSGPNVNITINLPGTQMSLIQMTSEIVAKNNEIRIAEELTPDFFIGPNGKILPKQFKKWIGKNKRDSLLNKVKNPMLKNAINQLYRPGSFIGDGGTASIIKFEKETGIGLGKSGGTHIQKGKEILRYIQVKILTLPDLSQSDQKIAKKMMKSLRNAIWR